MCEGHSKAFVSYLWSQRLYLFILHMLSRLRSQLGHLSEPQVRPLTRKRVRYEAGCLAR